MMNGAGRGMGGPLLTSDYVNLRCAYFSGRSLREKFTSAFHQLARCLSLMEQSLRRIWWKTLEKASSRHCPSGDATNPCTRQTRSSPSSSLRLFLTPSGASSPRRCSCVIYLQERLVLTSGACAAHSATCSTIVWLQPSSNLRSVLRFAHPRASC